MEPEKRQRILRIVLLSLLGGGVIYVVVSLQEVFAPLLFAFLLAYILNPVIKQMVRWRLPRTGAVSLLFLFFYAALTGFLVLAVPTLLTQVGNLYQSLVGETAYQDQAYPQKLTKEQEARLIKLEAPMPKDAAWYRPKPSSGRSEAEAWRPGDPTITNQEYEALSQEKRAEYRKVTHRVEAYLDKNGNGVYDPGTDVPLTEKEAGTPASRKGGRVVFLEPPYDGRLHWYVDDNGDGRYEPGYLRELASTFQKLKERVSRSSGAAVSKGLDEVRGYLVSTSQTAVRSTVKALAGAIYTIFGFLTAFVLIPIYLFYFLLGLPRVPEKLFPLFPGRYRDRIVKVLRRIDESVSAFFRGRLIIMAIRAVVTGLALWAVGLKYALFLGILTGVGSLIPIVGFLLGLLAGVSIALFDGGSANLALIVAVILVLIEFGDTYFMTPLLLKDKVGLHPVSILLSVFIAGALFGLVGMLLAIPLASVVKIVYLEFVHPEVKLLAAEKPKGTP